MQSLAGFRGVTRRPALRLAGAGARSPGVVPTARQTALANTLQAMQTIGMAANEKVRK